MYMYLLHTRLVAFFLMSLAFISFILREREREREPVNNPSTSVCSVEPRHNLCCPSPLSVPGVRAASVLPPSTLCPHYRISVKYMLLSRPT